MSGPPCPVCARTDNTHDQRFHMLFDRLTALEAQPSGPWLPVGRHPDGACKAECGDPHRGTCPFKPCFPSHDDRTRHHCSEYCRARFRWLVKEMSKSPLGGQVAPPPGNDRVDPPGEKSGTGPLPADSAGTEKEPSKGSAPSAGGERGLRKHERGCGLAWPHPGYPCIQESVIEEVANPAPSAPPERQGEAPIQVRQCEYRCEYGVCSREFGHEPPHRGWHTVGWEHPVGEPSYGVAETAPPADVAVPNDKEGVK